MIVLNILKKVKKGAVLLHRPYAPEDQEVSNRFRGDLVIFNELTQYYALQNRPQIS